MKIILSLTIGLFIALSSQAQSTSIDSVQLIGIWTVINGAKASGLPAEVDELMLMMLDGFNRSSWTFNSDGTFNLKFKENLSATMKEMKFLDNKRWKIDTTTEQIRIGTKSDNYNHLVLANELQGDKLKVMFNDTPIYLILEKQ